MVLTQYVDSLINRARGLQLDGETASQQAGDSGLWGLIVLTRPESRPFSEQLSSSSTLSILSGC